MKTWCMTWTTQAYTHSLTHMHTRIHTYTLTQAPRQQKLPLVSFEELPQSSLSRHSEVSWGYGCQAVRPVKQRVVCHTQIAIKILKIVILMSNNVWDHYPSDLITYKTQFTAQTHRTHHHPTGQTSLTSPVSRGSSTTLYQLEEVSDWSPR